MFEFVDLWIAIRGMYVVDYALVNKKRHWLYGYPLEKKREAFARDALRKV